MTIWIPPQQKTITTYMKWSTITAFVILMLMAISYFYDEYQDAEAKKQHAKETIVKIEEHNKSVDAQSAKAIQEPKTEKKVQKKVIIVERSVEEPTGGSPPMPPPPELPKTTPEQAVKSIPELPKVESNSDSKIEIDAWLVKVAMSNESSWMAIFKMIFTVLFTFFGIKLINFGFKKLEGEPKPA